MVVSEKILYYEFGTCRLDITNQQLINNDEKIVLAQKSFRILCYFIENRERFLTKEELLKKFWEVEYLEETNLAQQIYQIRKAIKNKDTNDSYIETKRKFGYRFTAEVREIYAHEKDTLKETSENNILDERTSEKLNGSNGFHNFADEPFYKTPTDKKPQSHTSFGKKSWLYVFGGLLLLSIFAFIYFSLYKTNETNDLSNIKSMAILPFKELGETQDEKFGLGLADTLISRFSNQSEISVVPTITIIKYVDKGTSPLEIGQKLNVDGVLTGTIQREDDNVRVNIQLINTKKTTPVWTTRVDAEVSDIFSLQDKIAEEITKKLPPLLVSNSKNLADKKYTKNREAFVAYSKGLALWGIHTNQSFKKGIVEFEKAVGKDPKFALAYAYMADCYAHLISEAKRIGKGKEIEEKGINSAKKALELDSNSAEAMAALALIYANTGKQSEAFKLMKTSIEISPNDSHNQHRLSWMYANRGEIDKALELAKTAHTLDPESIYNKLYLARILVFANQMDESIKVLKKAREIAPLGISTTFSLAITLELKGEYDEAEKELRKIEKEVDIRLPLSILYAKKGEKDSARKLLKDLFNDGMERKENYLLATAYIALGEEEKAIDILKDIIAQIGDSIYMIKFDPRLDPIRKNPKFIELLRQEEDSQGWTN